MSPSFRIEPVAGYSPVVGRLVAMLEYARATTLRAVEGMSVAALDQLHDATSNSIGALLAHIAVVERSYHLLTFEDRRPTVAELAAWEPALTLGNEARLALKERPLDHYVDDLAAGRRLTLEGLAKRDDEWLERPLAAAPAMNAHFAWFHAAEDEINHRGQIRWLRKRIAPGLVAVLAGFSMAASGCERPVAVELVRDTLVLYGPSPEAVPLRVRGDAATPAPHPEKLRLSTDSAARLEGGKLSCRRAGEGQVDVFVADTVLTLRVICRPARYFRTTPFVYLTLGDPPLAVGVEATLWDGRSESVRPLAIAFDDSAVVTVSEDKLFARGVGRSRFVMSLGGAEVSGRATVTGYVARDTFALAPGEFRSWRLERGRYEVTAKDVGRRGSPAEFDITTEGAHCARSTDDDDTIYCFVETTGGIGFRNLSADEAGPRRVVFIRVAHIP